MTGVQTCALPIFLRVEVEDVGFSGEISGREDGVLRISSAGDGKLEGGGWRTNGWVGHKSGSVEQRGNAAGEIEIGPMRPDTSNEPGRAGKMPGFETVFQPGRREALASAGKAGHLAMAAPETVAGVCFPEWALEESPDTTRQRAA